MKNEPNIEWEMNRRILAIEKNLGLTLFTLKNQICQWEGMTCSVIKFNTEMGSRPFQYGPLSTQRGYKRLCASILCQGIHSKREGMSQLKIVKLLMVVSPFSLEILVKQCPIHQGWIKFSSAWRQNKMTSPSPLGTYDFMKNP